MVGLLWTKLGKEAWGRVFTSDNEVLELCMAVLTVIGVCGLANCPQTTSWGVLRGSAKAGIGAGINLWSHANQILKCEGGVVPHEENESHN